MAETKFTFFWLDGKREVLEGADSADALNRAGYGAGAVRALDFFAHGDNDNYVWDARTGGWERKDREVKHG